MNLKSLISLNINKFVLGILLSISFINIEKSKAFIPFTYQPNDKSLTKTGLTIGRTAAQLMQLGQTKEAQRLGALAVRINPTDDRLWSILAEAQMRNNLLKEAESSISKAKEISPKKASLWFANASLSLQQKKPDTAINLIKKGLKLDPRNAGGYFQLGNARIMQNKFDLAIQDFKKAYAINNKFWEAINNEAIVLFETGKTKDAIARWRKVLEIKQNAEPMLALASALHEINPKNKEIFELAKTALKKNPNYVWSEYQKEQLWGKKLRIAAKRLLSNPKLEFETERAIANSKFNG